MPANLIRRASARRVNLKVSLCGPSNSGKTWTSIKTMHVLRDRLQADGLPVGNGEIVVIDSQHGQSEYYAGYRDPDTGRTWDFQIYDLNQFTPQAYTEAFNYVQRSGYSLVIVDSISHEWVGPGGLLEEKDVLISTRAVKNDFGAFAIVTPKHNKFKESIQNFPGHMICTIRSRTDWAMEQRDGKVVPRKLGVGYMQRDGIEYEFDIKGMIDIDHNIYFESRGLILNEKTLSAEDIRMDILANTMADFLVGKSRAIGDSVTSDEVEEVKRFAFEKLGIEDGAWSDILSGWGIAGWDSVMGGDRTPLEKIKSGLIKVLDERNRRDAEVRAQKEAMREKQKA